MMGKMKNIVIDKEALDELREAADKHWQENPPVLGEIFDDGQFRGHSRDVDAIQGGMRIGDYILVDDEGRDTFTILFKPTGEMGVFKKEDFVAHVAAFFGLHF